MSTQNEIILNRICQNSAEKRASEVYLLPAQPPFVRIDGKMGILAGESIITASFINDFFENILDEREQSVLEKEKQIEVIKNIGKMGECQIDIYYQKNSLACRIKLLAQEVIDLEKLGLPKMVTRFADFFKGIIFIAGPRDSGRSTLANSILNHINKNQAKFIATVEKPIKSILIGRRSVVEQREVGKDVLSFLSGLRYIRQRNADVVFVSQIDDAATMDEIFAIVEAGSLVFAIMDTESAIKTIKRILHFYPTDKEETARYFLSENLAGIVVSRLVPKIGGGRIRALEVLAGTPAVRSIIASGRFHQLAGVIQATEDQTSVSLDQSLVDLVTSGKVVSEEAIKHCNNEEIFRNLLRK